MRSSACFEQISYAFARYLRTYLPRFHPLALNGSDTLSPACLEKIGFTSSVCFEIKEPSEIFLIGVQKAVPDSIFLIAEHGI
jgi:hypothetical protein